MVELNILRTVSLIIQWPSPTGTQQALIVRYGICEFGVVTHGAGVSPPRADI